MIRSAHGTVFVFKILQHGSTVLGAALLIYAYRRWFKTAPMQAGELPLSCSDRVKTGLFALMMALAFLVATLYSQLSNSTIADNGLQAFVRKWVIASVGILFAELVVYSVIWHWKARR